MPANNSFSKEVFHIGPVQPPFICDFDDGQDMDRWTIVDANHDDVTWYWDARQVMIRYNRTQELDDYLITLCPVALEAGDAYIAFEYNARNSAYPEKLEVLYGTSPDPAEMTALAVFDSIISSTDGCFSAEALHLAQAGNYYFAFHACSRADMFGLILDDVEIGQGTYVGTPDLAINDILLPASACGLSSQTPVQVLVSNKGQADIVKLSLAYSLDGADQVREEFGTLPASKDTTFVFSQTMDLSVLGKHKIQIEAEVLVSAGKEESNLDNNAAIDSVISFSPAHVPFITDFSMSKQAENWVGDWKWDASTGGYVTMDYKPLFSCCVSLEASKGYRFLMEFKAGLKMFGMMFPETFSILCGMSGTDVATWDTLWKEENMYEENYVSIDASFECADAGAYSFAIVSSGALWISNISLSELTDYDVRLCSFDLPLARLMPLEHLNTSLNATVEVQNRGLKLSDVLVEIMQGTQVVGSSTATLAGLDDVIAVPVEFALSGLSVGDMPVLTARATLVGHADADLTRDNEKQFAMTVTQDEMAYDNVTGTMFANPSTYAVGSSATLAIGLPFRLSVRDTLTGISIGWGNPKNEEVELSIHRWNAATRTLGEKVYEGTVSAGTESRFVRYQLSGLLLEAGDYMISEKASGYILMTDMSAEGRLYVTSSDPVHLQQDVGYPAIRAIFGSDAVLTARDVAVEEFVKPRGNGLFSANQKVEVKVRNLGYDEVTVPVTLRVNKAKPVTRTVKLAAYESGIAAFTADMSMPSTDYVLTAIACMEGDSDHINDTLVKMFRSVAPTDPYRMDFEACQDWASEDFNPAWTTVDADGAPLGGWSQFSYPLLRQTAGFLVFNPSLTEPSLLDALPEYAAAHGGERYGASI